MRQIPRVFPLVLAGGLITSLGGCAASTEQIDAEPAVSTPPSATSGADPSTEANARTLDPEQCLQGSWLADNAYFLASLQEFGDAISAVDGRVTLTFTPDNTLTTEYADWLLTGSSEGAAVTISRTGADIGVYTVSGTTVTIEETSVGSTLTVTAGGMAMPIAPTPAIYSDASFTCDEVSASISTPDGTLLLTRE